MDKIKFGPAKEVYKGIIFDIHQKEAVLPNGDKKIFEFCLRPDSVTILPFDEKGRLVLIREYRHSYNGGKYMWFLPAGRIDENEKPIAAAKREMREEIGMGAKVIKKIYKKTALGSMIWNWHVFAAKDLYPAPLTGDESFKIEAVPTPLQKAVQMAIDGTIEHQHMAYHIIRFNYMLKHGEFKW